MKLTSSNSFHNSAPKTLIIGASGMLGKGFVDYLSSIGSDFICSQRQNVDDDWFLDLNCLESINTLITQVALSGIETVIVFAAITSEQQCISDKYLSQRINVDHTCLLLKGLHEQGVFSVFVSSSQVFDHLTPHITAKSSFSPTTFYGKQKVLVEQFITFRRLNVAIVRLTKVIGAGFALFDSVIRQAKNKETTYLFEDYCAAPISIQHASHALLQVLSSREIGLYQVSGEVDISYAEMASHLLQFIGSKHLVNEISSKSKGVSPVPFGSLSVYSSSSVQLYQQPFSEVLEHYFSQSEYKK